MVWRRGKNLMRKQQGKSNVFIRYNKYLQCVLCDMRITYLRQHLFINIKIPKKKHVFY